MEHVTSQNFQDAVLKEKKPVIVDFYADWCGPCKMLAPIMEELSKETPDVKFLKLDVEAESRLAMEYQVRSIPTVIVFKDGEVVEKVVGLMPKAQLKQMLAQHA